MVTYHVGSSDVSLAHNTGVLLPKWRPERKGRRRGDYCTITRNQPRFRVFLRPDFHSSPEPPFFWLSGRRELFVQEPVSRTFRKLKFSHPENPSKISNLTVTDLLTLFIHILSI